MRTPADILLPVLERLSLRERRLLVAFTAIISVTALYTLVVEPVVARRGSMESRITTLTRDMAAIGSLATRIEAIQERIDKREAVTASEGSLFALVDRLTSATVPPGSVESIVPNKGPDKRRARGSRVDLRLGGISLGQLVELLGRIEAQKGAIRVLHLDLKRRYEDSARFDASLTVASSAEGT